MRPISRNPALGHAPWAEAAVYLWTLTASRLASHEGGPGAWDTVRQRAAKVLDTPGK